MKNKFTWIIAIVLLVISCSKQSRQLEMEWIYVESLNNLIDHCWNKKDFSSIHRVLDANYTRVINDVSVASNPNELEANIKVYQQGFPDLKIKVNETIFKGNKAFLEWTFLGSNTGMFGEYAATGKKVETHGFSVVYFNRKGQIFKEEIYYNELAFLQQMGYTLIPPNIK